MIFGIGVDIVDVKRIERAYSKRNFFARVVLSQREFQIFAERNFSPTFLAGRFAAKEAIMKAISLHLGAGKKLSEIEILPSSTGSLNIFFKGEVLKFFNSKDLKKISISIAHEKNLAIGFAVAER